MIAITLKLRIVAYSASIPAGLRRSVKPRLHPFSRDECKRRHKWRRVGPNWLIYICPNHCRQISGFCFVRFSRASPLSLKRRSQGRVRQDNVINYRASKPLRAFICTPLALSMAPLLIFSVETTSVPSFTDFVKSRVHV